MWGKRRDMIVHEVEPFNSEPPRSALANEVLTPVDTFYTRNHGTVPELDPADWTLRVDGLVERPATFSLAGLRQRFAEHSEVAVLQCAGNRRAELLKVADIPGEAPWGPAATANARWSGVRLSDVLRDVGISPAATHVEFVGADVSPEADPPEAFGGSIPKRKALAGEVLLAWAMNDEPLPPVHGAPVRVVVPGYIGARSVKWVNRITALDHSSHNFFQARTYRMLPPQEDRAAGRLGHGFELGLIAINSDVLQPDDGARVAPGPVPVTGYAFAGGDRTIVRVDISTDGGRSWWQADLGEQISQWSWRHWSTTVEVPEGSVEVAVRAWDSSAAVQPESAAGAWNPKGYANNSWARVTLHGDPSAPAPDPR
jgi:sulfite oxidase